MKKFLLALLLPGAALAECPPVPEPIHGLSVVSRYKDGTGSTVIDADAQAEAVEELKPVDDFIRDVAELGDKALAGSDVDAVCALNALQVWAEAGALGALQTDTSRLTIGSRIAGMALIARQLRAHVPDHPGWPAIEAWFSDLIFQQRVFWERDAPPGASQGNLRAWAALGGAAVADVTNDPLTRAWATWSAGYVLCTAQEDGSLPQEMLRGKHALHYQLHAVAPLVVTAALLRPHGVDLMDACDAALPRAARFAIADLATGARSEALSGARQSFFDGSRKLGSFQLAWIEAYLTLQYDAAMEAMVAPMRPVSHSKLGGDQTLAWR